MAERNSAATTVGGALSAIAVLVAVAAMLIGVVAVAFDDGDRWKNFALIMLGAAGLLVVCGTVLLAVGERKRS